MIHLGSGFESWCSVGPPPQKQKNQCQTLSQDNTAYILCFRNKLTKKTQKRNQELPDL
jgi:hypothetical protein